MHQDLAGAFEWYYGWEETVQILEGQVRVTSATGRVHVLRACGAAAAGLRDTSALTLLMTLPL